MKIIKWNLMIMMTIMLVVITNVSCKKATLASELTLVALTADGINLNGSSSATGVDINASITATFSYYVDASSASSSNIKLTRVSDSSSIALLISVSQATVTITHASALEHGTQYTLFLGSGLRSTLSLGFKTRYISFTTI